MSAPFTLAPSVLSLLSEVIHVIARSKGLRPDEAEDFAQTVHLKLLERNYAPIASYEGRSSLRTFLAVVVTRNLLDWRNAHYGKWRPSARARRLGAAAVDFERLVGRDGLTNDEAIGVLSGRPAPIDGSALRKLAARLPPRRRIGIVAIDDVANEARSEFDDPVETEEASAARRRVQRTLREAYRRLAPEDRRLIRLRFGRGLSIKTIASLIGAPTKPLYRRFARVKASLREALTRAGVTAAA